MPSTEEIYGGAWLKASNLEELGFAGKVLTIAFVKTDEFRGKKKLTVSFMETDRSMTINKTQADAIASKHGKDYTAWRTKQIKVSRGMTEFPRGSKQMVPTIDVKPV